jgi:hypothetical protein
LSLRGSTTVRTICEVLREINDELQGTARHPLVLPLLIEAEGMAKRMSRKLVEYNKDVYKGWWEKNPDYEADIKRRLSETYVS